MIKRKICIITDNIHSIDAAVKCIQLSCDSLISSILLLSNRIATMQKYDCIDVFPADDFKKCILQADEVLFSKSIESTKASTISGIVEFINKNHKTIRNNLIEDKINELKINAQNCAFSEIKIPTFVITTMLQDIGEQKLLIELTKHINALGEKVLNISNGYGNLFFENHYPLPIENIETIARGEKRILYLNSYLQKAISKTNSTIMIILVNGSFCNPYMLPSFETPYYLSLIESACAIDYHINVVPLNFSSIYSLRNNNLRINRFSKKQTDVNVISNVLFDVPNEDVYETGSSIPTVVVTPNSSNAVINAIDKDENVFCVSLSDDKSIDMITNNIVDKLKPKTSSYKNL